MIRLKKILKEISQASDGHMAPGELAWSHAKSVAIDKKWQAWRMEAMNQINLLGWTKLADLIDDSENDLDRDNKGLKFAGEPANEPIYGLEVIEKENDGFIYQMDKWVHNKKRVFEK